MLDGEAHTHGAMRIASRGELAAPGHGEMATFTFDGAVIEGRPGEPLAVALLAAGVRVFRTMPESGEPRGGYCFVGRCADCQVIVDGTPGVMACITPVQSGLHVQTQHGLGGDDLTLDGEAMP